jgi:aminomethyltransferase
MNNLKQLPLHAMHETAGGKFAPFAGYDMPVQYTAGVMAEHLHTRKKAGLFDVSHMGQHTLPLSAGEPLEALLPSNIRALPIGRQCYSLLTTASGGVLDDLMIARRADDFLLVVNASRNDADLEHLSRHIEGIASVNDRVLLALQGPCAETVMMALMPDAAQMRFMDVAVMQWQGHEIWISRSGYTGEDGFEISIPVSAAEEFTHALLKNEDVALCGLGARDSLRMEAGMPLYGHELTEDISPVEAGLSWVIHRSRRATGASPGGFLGADRILRELDRGAPRRHIGLLPQGRAPMREGVLLYDGPESSESIGVITSGGFSPSNRAPIAMALIKSEVDPCAPIFGEVRGKRLEAQQVAPLFHQPNYKR